MPPSTEPDDETTDSQRSAPRDVMRRAHDDATSGQQDTDRAPLTDALYDEQTKPAGEATRDRGAPKTR